MVQLEQLPPGQLPEVLTPRGAGRNCSARPADRRRDRARCSPNSGICRAWTGSSSPRTARRPTGSFTARVILMLTSALSSATSGSASCKPRRFGPSRSSRSNNLELFSMIGVASRLDGPSGRLAPQVPSPAVRDDTAVAVLPR